VYIYLRAVYKTNSFSHIAILIFCQPRLKKKYLKQLGINSHWSMRDLGKKEYPDITRFFFEN
jgi:hypothetical protein